MYITKELTARMERCIKQSHIEVTKQYSQGKILEVNGGAACFSGFDSFLSQVVGWGFKTEPKHYKAEIETIEHFYKSLGHNRIDIELCPFVGNHLINFLSQRGYQVTELNNVSVLNLKNYNLFTGYDDDWFIIREVKQSELEEWAKRVAIGFGFPEAQEQFYKYASAKGILAFAAYDKDNLIAGATMAIHGDVCDLGVTSTLPIYRGKGLQKKLLFSRLSLAKQYGLELATVTTEPGTVSDLNVQKAGFCCAYTRVKLTKES